MTADEVELVERGRAGDPDAKRALVERATLRVARLILGGDASGRFEALRELARGDGPAPALGVLLAAVATDGAGEVKRAAELLHRVSSDRWGPPEREAIGRFAARHGAALGSERALDLLEWAARFPGELDDFVRGAAAGLAGVAEVASDAWTQLAWQTGFEHFVVRDRELVVRWSAVPASAKAVARALLAAHARGTSACAALDAIWAGAPRREVWAAALGEATSQNRGMSGRDEIAAWGWRRFCAHAGERRDLYAAFEPWRDHWIELRNATALPDRPGGGSAVAHLRLWGGLDVTLLSASVDEAVRLARDGEWAELVDAAFDLAEAAPAALRLHALAGACRIGHEVCNRARGGDPPSAGPGMERGGLGPTRGIDAGSDRFIARAEALAGRLRDSGAVVDQIVANRAEDLETDVRLICEARARVAEAARYAAEREESRRLAAEAAEQARRDAERARRDAEEARSLAMAQLQAHVQAPIGPPGVAMPRIAPDPIDDEIFFSSLPAAPTLLAYARLFKRLTTGANAVQSLAAEGVTMEMVAVINQTWSMLFAQRVDLAIRFSTLIAAPWA